MAKYLVQASYKTATPERWGRPSVYSGEPDGTS